MRRQKLTNTCRGFFHPGKKTTGILSGAASRLASRAVFLKALLCLILLLIPSASSVDMSKMSAASTLDRGTDTLAPSTEPKQDYRIGRLEHFFGRYKCPGPWYIAEYLKTAEENGLDYRLLPAISVRETHCGQFEKNNNRLGFHPGHSSFPSVPAAIRFIGERINKHPLYNGLSLAEKLFRYNPLASYPGEVQFIMRQIEP
jgi:hypothetical protein